jgi:hypothetical protein
MAQKKLPAVIVMMVLIVAVLWQAAHIAAQVNQADSDLFVLVRTIGSARPSGIRYDPNFDRFAWVDAQGQLVIVNAATFEPIRVIYPNGTYEAFNFSRDGRLLALAIGVRIEVWDIDSGMRLAAFEPPGANHVQGPLQFTRNDELLAFDTVVPAPQELRRSENDTIILPWVWDVAAARDQRRSVLANRVEAYPFYSTRVSMAAGDDGILVAGLDSRIQVFDADTDTMEVIVDLPAERLEADPVQAWHSTTDPYLYVSLNRFGQLLQINTQTNETQTIELGYDLDLDGLNRLQALDLSRALQTIGSETSQMNALTQLLLGSDYALQPDYVPSALHLLDVLVPVIDDPLVSPGGNTALLIYDFDEGYDRGAVDMIRPGDVSQLALNPNTVQLAIRRTSGPVEFYNTGTGALERIIDPAERDAEARRTFAYSGDGQTLLIDFERYDTETGERLARVENYTEPFNAYLFTPENQLITFGGTSLQPENGGATTWRLWDVQTGHLIREDSFVISGDVISVSNDQLRYLTRSTAPDGTTELTIIDGHAGETQTFSLPVSPAMSLSSIFPNDDWTRFLLVYSSSDPTTGNVLSPVAVYNRAGEQLYFDAGNNLPAGALTYEWRDERTIAIASYAGSMVSPAPLLGLEYHPSGLPQCVVDTVPNWRALVPVWERLVYESPRDRVSAITQQLCVALTGEGAQSLSAAQGTPALTPDVTAIAALLTPTPGVYYQSGRTPAPIAVPGVPTCITARYQREAIAYADLWRQITEGVTDAAQLAELEDMICEGLLTGLGDLQPTPTVNPDALVVATPTAMEAAPVTTGGNENAYNVMTIDIVTGARTLAEGVTPVTPAQRLDPTALISAMFNTQYRVYPNNPVTSPDGQYLAARSDAGFVTVYRLSRPVSALVQDEENAAATRAAQGPRSLGLAPTATPQPQSLDAALPTLTPTMTLTPIPLTDAEPDLPDWGKIEFICPARALADVSQSPADFNPPGTLIVQPLNASGSLTWTLNPRTGALMGTDQLPPFNGGTISPDGVWIVYQQQANDGGPGDIVVSRVDGSQPATLYTSVEARLINPSFRWREPHTLEISYSGVLPTVSPGAISLARLYDPETSERSEGGLVPTMEPLGLLPFERTSRQPYGTLEVLAEYAPGGTRYWLRDTANGQSEVFVQGDVWMEWQPAGRFLYYFVSGTNYVGESYIYDTASRRHARVDAIPGGLWSPDGRLRVSGASIPYDQIVRTLMRGDLPPSLQVWDSETGQLRTYCFPESNGNTLASQFIWSPDSRYVAFTVNLPIGGDVRPTPTFAISPEAPPATATPIPLETQYDYQFPRTIVLDTETGIMTIISTDVSAIERWIGE